MYQSLSSLRIGQSAKVHSINIKEKNIKQHLMDMGITRGTEVSIKKISPTGDPMVIAVRGYELCINKKELTCVFVEAIKNENCIDRKSK